jgi:hypothetical protein
MTDSLKFDDIVAQLRALMLQEYRRGQEDTTRRILAAAQSAVSPVSTTVDDTDSTTGIMATLARTSRAVRAAKGVPDRLIVRVLKSTFPAGATSTKIHRMAESEEERKVSLSGIRFALDRGKRTGHYHNQGGEWFLTSGPVGEPTG